MNIEKTRKIYGQALGLALEARPKDFNSNNKRLHITLSYWDDALTVFLCDIHGQNAKKVFFSVMGDVKTLNEEGDWQSFLNEEDRKRISRIKRTI